MTTQEPYDKQKFKASLNSDEDSSPPREHRAQPMQPQHPQNQTLRTQPGANPDMSSLVKVQDKLTVPVADVADDNLELNPCGLRITLDWEFYSTIWQYCEIRN